MRNPLSAGVMCHDRMRTGSAKASASALNASKNVALPTTMRAFACHRENGTFSRRAINVDSGMREAVMRFAPDIRSESDAGLSAELSALIHEWLRAVAEPSRAASHSLLHRRQW